jgi:hypothetical protein
LAGIFTNRLPDIASYGSPPGAMASMELEQRLREDGEATHRRLADRFGQLSVANELRKIEETPVELRRAVTTEARCADLFVASCPRGAGLGKWAPLIEGVLFDGGHGLILLPEQFKSREAIDTVIIGWVGRARHRGGAASAAFGDFHAHCVRRGAGSFATTYDGSCRHCRSSRQARRQGKFQRSFFSAARRRHDNFRRGAQVFSRFDCD